MQKFTSDLRLSRLKSTSLLDIIDESISDCCSLTIAAVPEALSTHTSSLMIDVAKREKKTCEYKNPWESIWTSLNVKEPQKKHEESDKNVERNYDNVRQS